MENRILIVDDDEGVLDNISKALKLEGYQVDVASTGKKAIESTKRNFYNLALIDIRLPDLEGTELLTAMKDTIPRMVKIILTGYPALPNAVTALNKGADGYLTKPVKMDELIKTIKEHLVKQARQNEFDEDKVSEFIETRIKKMDADQNTKP